MRDFAPPVSTTWTTRTMPANIQQRPEPIALGNQPLTLEWVLGQLIADGLVTAENAKPLQQVSTARKKPVHPLLVIAEKKWPDPEKHSKPLTLERLTEWLAAKTDIEYRHIDPFKIEFSNNGGAWATLANNLPADDRSYNFTVPSVTAGNILLRLIRSGDTVQIAHPVSIMEIPRRWLGSVVFIGPPVCCRDRRRYAGPGLPAPGAGA